MMAKNECIRKREISLGKGKKVGMYGFSICDGKTVYDPAPIEQSTTHLTKITDNAGSSYADDFTRAVSFPMHSCQHHQVQPEQLAFVAL